MHFPQNKNRKMLNFGEDRVHRHSAGGIERIIRLTNHRNAIHMHKNGSENVTVEVVCKVCGAGQLKPFRYFRDQSALICSGCGSEISLNNQQFRGSIAEFEDTMKRLQ